MQISKRTLEILENFSSINKSIAINEEGFIKNISAAKNIIGLSKIEETFPNFCIFDLNEFVSIIKMFDATKDIDFVFGKDEVIIKQAKTKVNYKLANPDHIYNKTIEYDRYFKDTQPQASFKLTNETLSNCLKASKIMGLKTINVSIEDDKGEISLYDENNSAANQYRLEIEGNGNCDADLDISLINFIRGDYDVFVFDKHIRFDHNDGVSYIVLKNRK